MEKDTLNTELVWQQRYPGGVCILVDVLETREECPKEQQDFWLDHDFPILKIFHPEEGLTHDPSYYYCSLEEALMEAEYYEEDNTDEEALGSHGSPPF